MTLNKYILIDIASTEKVILPVDVKASILDLGVSWREAKKQLRAYYLNKAASLRSLTEKDLNAKTSN